MSDATIIPATWPLKWRRAFLLTLPISGPIWCLVFCIVVIGLLIAAAVYFPSAWLKEKLWDKREADAESARAKKGS